MIDITTLHNNIRTVLSFAGSRKDGKAWIYDLWMYAYRMQTTLAEFKAELLNLNNQNRVVLSRCDLPQLAKLEQFRNSEASMLEGFVTFHFVSLPKGA